MKTITIQHSRNKSLIGKTGEVTGDTIKIGKKEYVIGWCEVRRGNKVGEYTYEMTTLEDHHSFYIRDENDKNRSIINEYTIH